MASASAVAPAKGAVAAGGSKPAPRKLSRNSVIHDQFNLYVLPVLGMMALLGVLGLVDGMKTTVVFTAYIVLDIAWILLQSDAVPAMPGVIVFHHLVVLILLAYPMRYPHFAIYSNWDGLVEINTFFLVARRQVKEWRWLYSPLFWVTFFPTRFLIHPYLVLKFWEVTAPYSLFEQVLVTAAQVMLCAFNVLFLQRAIPRDLTQRIRVYLG
mmetsp:Transcript_29344/g.75341  ORF Transcript_29344/g.75341 Transcript_29344/m.75341 type:complete len:211 (+) Transcript_29344:338-970(+)|eukprot:jgi/Tetstr1/456340/TSEL_043076.t1